jgi:hypothetical protein
MSEHADNPMEPTTDIEAAIRDLANAQGVSPEEFLSRVDRRIDERMAEVRSPCLLPDDLIDYQTFGRLRPDLELHREQCSMCNQLLHASVPDPLRVQQMRDRVAASAHLHEQLSAAARIKGWDNWRVPVAGMVMVTIICVAFLDRPSPIVGVGPGAVAVQGTHNGITLAALTQTNDGEPAPVTIRLRALTGSSITVTDSDVQTAASTAALAKHPPTFTVPPYASTDVATDNSQRDATEKTIALVARIAPEWQSSGRDRHALVTEAVAQVPGVQCKSLDAKTGRVSLAFVGRQGVVNTDFNLNAIVKTANRYEPIIGEKWLNSNISDVKPIQLDHQVSIQILPAQNRTAPPSSQAP